MSTSQISQDKLNYENILIKQLQEKGITEDWLIELAKDEYNTMVNRTDKVKIK